MPDLWRVPPGKAISLVDVDPAATPGAPGDKATTEAALPALREALSSLQDKLWAEATRSLLIVLQGMDSSGKDGTIRHVFTGVNPQATSVTAFKAPAGPETEHDFLWRAHLAAPEVGRIAIWNRSHYEDVLAARVRGLVPPKVWKARYELINAFEAILAHGGTTVVKCFLHISKDEQRRRLEARLREPDKRWKFRAGDLDDRARWKDYQQAYEDVLRTTSTDRAPWYVVPADRKWYRNWAVSRVIVHTLEAMDPKYPAPPDLGDVRIT